MCKMFTKCKLLHYEHRYEQTERENADSREHAEHERTGAERLSALLFRRRTDGAFADYPHRLGDHVVLSLRRRAVAQYEIRFLEDRAFGIADIDYSSFASFYHAVFPFTHVFDRRHCRLRYCTPFTAAVGILFYYPLIFLCVFSDKRPPGLNSCSTEKKAPRMCRPSDVPRGRHNKSAERTVGVRSAPIPPTCRSAGEITRPPPCSFGTCGIRGIRKISRRIR